MRKITKVSLMAVLVCMTMFMAGCAGTLGTSSANVSGQFVSGGKVIDAGVQLGNGNVTLSGLFGQGSNTVGGSITVPVSSVTNAVATTSK